MSDIIFWIIIGLLLVSDISDNGYILYKAYKSQIHKHKFEYGFIMFALLASSLITLLCIALVTLIGSIVTVNFGIVAGLTTDALLGLLAIFCIIKMRHYSFISDWIADEEKYLKYKNMRKHIKF